MKDQQKINTDENVNIEINFSGTGSEFNQGFISKEVYNNWLKLKDTVSWNKFCVENLEKDGYWEISDVSSFTAINIDFLKIEIKVENEIYFVGDYNEFIERFFEEEGEVPNSKNISNIYGTNNFPKNWNSFFNPEEFNKREKILTTSKTIEIFNVSEKLSIKPVLNINKFGFLVLSTDEMGYGIDHGDFVIGFTYYDEIVYFEFPGGFGNIDTPSFD
jgi:hypothetical protein